MKNIILHPLFFAIVPILGLFEHNKNIASPYYIQDPLLVSVMTTLILFSLLSFLINNFAKAALLSSITVLSFFFFYDFSQLFAVVNNFIPEDLIHYIELSLIIYMIVMSAIYYLIISSHKNFLNINKFLNIFGITIIAIQLLSIINYQIQHQNYIPENEDNKKQIANTNNQENLPDIYYIVLDGYGRQDVFSEMYNYNNEDFINKLEEKGFYVADNSYSNYNKTILSLPSSLNMEYIEDILTRYQGDNYNQTFFKNIIKNSAVTEILENNNYTFVTLPYTWFGNYKNLKSDIHLGSKTQENSFNAILIGKTPLYIFLPYLEMKASQANTLELLKQMPKVAEIDQTTFSYIHIMASHPPFYFDENGPRENQALGCITGGDGSDYYTTCPGVERYRLQLVEQVKYFNRQINDIIDEILAKSETEPIIIIQGDHGPGSEFDQENLDNTNLKERMAILNAYYVPETIKKDLYPSISPINSFRLIFNKLFNTDYPLLEDRHYFATKHGFGKEVEVTAELKKLD